MRENIAPKRGISRSSFFEAINNRGIEQLQEVFNAFQAKASELLPKEYQELGGLIAIDGSFVDATLSMEWAEYRDGSKKAKSHFGFDINRGIPHKVFLTNGKADEREYVSPILSPGETGVMDRYNQCHEDFDRWQKENKHFVCRIRENTILTVVRKKGVVPESIVFYDFVVLLGTKGTNQTEKEVRVVGYRIDDKMFWIATDRHDLTAEQVAQAYKLRWNIEIFFGWWKRHLNVYHLIARSEYGLQVKLLGGLITYLLLAIYCHEQHHEKVNISRVRELCYKIKNEAAQ